MNTRNVFKNVILHDSNICFDEMSNYDLLSYVYDNQGDTVKKNHLVYPRSGKDDIPALL